MENTRAMYEICSKLAIKTPWQPNLNLRYSELHDFTEMNDDVKIAMIHNFANQEQHCVRSV